MESLVRKLSIGFALVAVFLTGTVSARGLVLCLEPDGHVSIEVAGDCADCCANEGTDSGPRIESCPCVDVPIGTPDASPQKPKPPAHGGVASPSRLCFAATGNARHERIRAPALPRFDPSLALVRSVVLLV